VDKLRLLGVIAPDFAEGAILHYMAFVVVLHHNAFVVVLHLGPVLKGVVAFTLRHVKMREEVGVAWALSR
jgi:hypothetical protein